MNISQVFNEMINKSIEMAELVSEPREKAQIYTAVAQALAATGKINVTDNEETEKELESKAKINSNKESLKNKPKKATEAKTKDEEKPADKPIKQEAAAELTEEWTNQAIDVLNDELDFMTTKRTEYGDEAINACIVEMSNGVYKTIDDITPLNIKALVSYIQQLEAEQETA